MTAGRLNVQGRPIALALRTLRREALLIIDNHARRRAVADISLLIDDPDARQGIGYLRGRACSSFT
jgi:hypothetical protein